MFLSIDQISHSLPFLEDLNPFFGMSFLAFKKAGIPVGEARPLVFSTIAQDILDRHYKPLSNYAGFYTPFKTFRPIQALESCAVCQHDSAKNYHRHIWRRADPQEKGIGLGLEE